MNCERKKAKRNGQKTFCLEEVLSGPPKTFCQDRLEVLSGKCFVRKMFCQDRLRNFVRTILYIIVYYTL